VVLGRHGRGRRPASSAAAVPGLVLLPDAPSAPVPHAMPRDAVGALIPTPGVLHAADVDVFVSDRGPWWPNERQARRANACLGPLYNAAGQALTARSVRRSSIADPTPEGARVPGPKGQGDRVRMLAAALHDDLLWVCEQWGSRRLLTDGAADLPA
jgi:hypothetical protein